MFHKIENKFRVIADKLVACFLACVLAICLAPVAAFASTQSGTTTASIDILLINVSSKYSSTVEPWKALSLCAANRYSDSEKQALLKQALKDMKAAEESGYSSVFQKYIIALTAAGFDASALPDASASDSSATYNALQKMDEAMAAQVEQGTDTIWMYQPALLAYKCGNYADPENVKVPQAQIIDKLVSLQNEDGSFYASDDADTTAMVISALQPYAKDNANAASAMNKALTSLKKMQNKDGGFGFCGSGGISNANSTAMAIIALCSVGIDPTNQWTVEDGSTPMSALLKFANAKQTSFTYDNEDNDLACEQSFRALVAYTGLKNVGGEYNIYIQASAGKATFKDAKSDTDKNAAGSKSKTNAKDKSSAKKDIKGSKKIDNQDSNAAPATGDANDGYVFLLSFILVASALCIVAIAMRKKLFND